MTDATVGKLKEWAQTYNDPKYFSEDPIIFPKHFSLLLKEGKAVLQDIEIAGIFAAHFAWGRRAMIVRDTRRLLDEMDWHPYDYVMRGRWRSDEASAHRTVKWSEVAMICQRLKAFYESCGSLEKLGQDAVRTGVFGQKSDLKAPNKKINMLRRWLARDDGKVDLGVWKNTDPADLLIPLDVHVARMAVEVGLSEGKHKDIREVEAITSAFREIFPGDPCLGDFSLFGYGVTHQSLTKDK